jgi:SAM-dependent methyltransferase
MIIERANGAPRVCAPSMLGEEYAVVMDEGAIHEHYATGYERERLARGSSRIEFARTKELLRRFLPSAPATVLDVGGGPGAYAAWLADEGYQVHLVDALPLHVEQAAAAARGRDPSFTVALGDARSLAEADSSWDAVLMLGPLYHLIERDERVRALAEAKRVLHPGGVVTAAAISRFASLLDGLESGWLGDPAFDAIVERDLAEGKHENPTDRPEWFTTAFFHDPDVLRAEVDDAGLELEALLGIEGPGWLLWELWDEPQGRENIMRVARAVEQEPSLIGVSAHLLVVGRNSR